MHPAFPFIVGLWFAALLGIGSLVVPVPVIERLVDMTGLAAIVPQTAPPLGFTARALIALTATVGGGLAGLLIARKVGQAHRDRTDPRKASSSKDSPRKDRGQDAARRPISAHEELGTEGLDGRGWFGAPRARRALAIEVEQGPSEVFELAPLPGKSLPLSALDLAEVDALELADAEMIADEPLEAGPDAGASMPGFTSLADHDADTVFHDAADEDFSMAERQHFRLGTFGQKGGVPVPPRQQFVLDPAPMLEEPAAVAELPEAEADLHFSPPSLARPFGQPDFAPEHVAEHAEEAEMDDFAKPAGLEPVPAPQAAAPAADWREGEVEDLALVQLAQRLGSSIARRREQRAAAAAAVAASAAPAPVPAAMPAVLAEEFDAAEAAEATRAMAAYFGSAAASVAPAAAPAFVQPVAAQPDRVVAPLAPPSPPAATPAAGRQMFRPVDAAPAPQPAPLANLAHIDVSADDEDEDEHIASLTASFSLPLANKAPFAEQHAEQAEDEEVTVVAARGPTPFANPFQQKAQPFVRIENEPQLEDGAIEPAVVFPGEARADAGPAASPAGTQENERALREALLSLQRMSGVA